MGSTTVQAAPARDYAAETAQTLQNQINLAPQLYQSEAQYQPLYNQLQLQNTQQSLLGTPGGQMGLLDIYGQAMPQYGNISAAANTQQRAADIADVQNLGPQASQAFMAANPELAASLQQAQGFAGPQQNQYSNMLGQQLAQQQPREDVYAQQVRAGNINQGALGGGLYSQAMNAGPSQISNALQSAVMTQMSPDGSLTPAEMRQAEQQVRASYAARGMAMSPQAISAEVQNRLVNQRQRQMENLNMAQSVNAQLQSEQAANRNFATGVYGQDIGMQGQNVANRMQAQMTNQQANLNAGQANRSSAQNQYQNYIQNLGQGSQLADQQLAANRGYAAQMVGLRQATASDPFQAILGRPSTAFQASQGLGNQGMQNTQMAGPSLFNPESSYANNIFGGNQQAQNAANMASAANSTALIGGAMGMAGNMAKMCWVAREVYGENNPRWIEFRTWLLTRSPNWFKKTYEKYGSRFAQFISDKPKTKRAIRFWMDSRIATLSA